MADHSPDTPFGCAVTWGPAVAIYGSDGRLHICELDHCDHEPPHVCHCGEEWDGADA